MADGNIGQQAASAVDAKIQEFQALQEEIGKSNHKLGTLMAQRNENELVKQELDICQLEAAEGKDAVIFKQVGPVLIKNDLSEAKDTVEKRLEFITGELKKTESFIQTKETQAQELAQKIQEMQMAMQRAAVEAAKVAAAQQQQTA
mmetsp:Transcript_21690/g.51080  ORF Transcript_21690/g.51080 Transcript_21690/m.51080 type:complete len:146 (-) Transcript_21690:50-487(-)